MKTSFEIRDFLGFLFFSVIFADDGVSFMIWGLVFYLFYSYGKMYSVPVGFHARRFVVRNRPCLRTVN